MSYPDQRKRLEQKYGEPFDVLLPRLANKYGSLKAVAEALGYSRQTVTEWAREIGMVRTNCFRVEDERESAAR